MPEMIAYYIANAYYRSSMYESAFDLEYETAKDLVDIFHENKTKVKSEVINLLRVKYALIVVNENPLEFKKIEY